jgi:hypothetical protein
MRPPNDEIEKVLASIDVSCAGCGYNLRGTTATRCPECAKEIDLDEIEAHLSRPPPSALLGKPGAIVLNMLVGAAVIALGVVGLGRMLRCELVFALWCLALVLWSGAIFVSVLEFLVDRTSHVGPRPAWILLGALSLLTLVGWLC